MVAGAQAPQPEGQNNVGAMRQDHRRMAPQTQNTSSVAIGQVCRQTSEVGAVCGKAARTVLCGGRSVMGVPTAIDRASIPAQAADCGIVAGHVPVQKPSPEVLTETISACTANGHRLRDESYAQEEFAKAFI